MKNKNGWPNWLSDEAVNIMKSGYLQKNETPHDVYERVANAVSKYMGDSRYKADIYEVLWNGWLGLASPVFANFGTERGLPISCYGISIDDSLDSIFSHTKEVSRMESNGGAVGVYLGEVRGSGSKISGGGSSTGVVPIAGIYDRMFNYVSQGGFRRGSGCFYLPIDHPDIESFLNAKSHFGDHRKYIDSNIGVCVTDDFMQRLLEGDKKAGELWAKILSTQMKAGSPYLFFTDNVNKQNPEAYTLNGLKVKQSQLCSEITLYSDEDHSFVCNLSSLNVAKYDEWKDWCSHNKLTLEGLSIVILDAVAEEFINKTETMPSMGRARRFALKSRALGLGVMGVAYYYQKQGWAFKSYESRKFNKELFKRIQKNTDDASRQLAQQFGEPEWCKGTGKRNTHLVAVAPTHTNSILTGAFSAGVEPITSNIFIAKEAKGSYVRKNLLLEELLKSKGKNTDEVWESILLRNGSVIHLDFLSYDEKQVFFTAREISQMEIVRQACERQVYIDQAQSINRFYHPDTPIEELNRHVVAAWANGLKTLYYTKSSSDTSLRVVRDEAMIVTKPGCSYCAKAKSLMDELGIKYIEHKAAEISTFCFKTYPQIWYQGSYVGGYDQFVRLLEIQKRGAGISGSSEYKDCKSCEA